MFEKLYQNKAGVATSINENEILTDGCWNQRYQPLSIDVTNVVYTGRYRIGLNSIFVSDSPLFSVHNDSVKEPP